MGRHTRLLAGVVAALALGAATGTASANRLSISSQSFRLNWAPATIAGQSGSGISVECNLTFEGSFQRTTTEKTVGQPLGDITRPTLGTCTGGSATLLSETLPWHITYEAFTGTLPNITGVVARFIGVSIGITDSGLPCLLRTEAEHPVSATAIRGEGSTVTGVRFDETDLIVGAGNFVCRMLRLNLSGTGRFLAANGEAFRYTLI